MKDYYATLGVTPQAEDIVIKAAYRALAQRYHPDRFAGSANEANRKMVEINEAYGVLSDPLKRKAYDAEYQQAGGNEGNFEAGDAAADEGVKQIDQDWETALEYYPDLVTLEAVLAKTSKSLAFTFRLYMITEKVFKNRKQIAELLHNAFLTNYFGEQRAVLDFAKTLIGIGRKDAAKALNEAVRVLGDDLDPILVINKIKGRFSLFDQDNRPRQCAPKKAEEKPPVPPPPLTEDEKLKESDSIADKLGVDRKLWRVAFTSKPTVDTVRALVDQLGGRTQIWGSHILVSLKTSTNEFANGEDFVIWFQSVVVPYLARSVQDSSTVG